MESRDLPRQAENRIKRNSLINHLPELQKEKEKRTKYTINAEIIDEKLFARDQISANVDQNSQLSRSEPTNLQHKETHFQPCPLINNFVPDGCDSQSVKTGIEPSNPMEVEVSIPKGRKKIIFIFVVLILVSCLVVGIVLGVKLKPGPSGSKEPEARKSTTIILRQPQNNTIYIYNATHTMNIDQTNMSSQYRLCMVVADSFEGKYTIVGTYQKLSTQTNNQTIYLNQTTLFCDMLIKGKLQDESNPTSSNFNEGDQGDYTKAQPFALPLFKFIHFPDGTIQNFTFPTTTPKDIVAILRAAIQSLSPQLASDLYQNKEFKNQKIWVPPESNGRLLQGDNQLPQPDRISESTLYNSNKSGDTLGLTSTKQIQENRATHNSNTNLESEAILNADADVTSAITTSETNFTSPTEGPNPNYTVHNLNINLSVKQKMILGLDKKLIGEAENVEKFIALLSDIESKKQATTVDLDKLDDWIAGRLTPQTPNIPKSRILVEGDSINVTNITSTLLKTNIIGCKVFAFCYYSIDIRQVKSNQTTEKSILVFSAGTILQIGFKNFTFENSEFTKGLPSLPLKYTLVQVIETIKSLKSEFLSKFESATQLLKIDQYKQLFNENFLSLFTLISGLKKEIQTLLNQVYPENDIANLMAFLKEQLDAIRALEESLFKGGIETLRNTSSEIEAYTKAFYIEAIAELNKIKEKLKLLQTKAVKRINETVEVYQNNSSTPLIKSLIESMPQSLLDQYYEQMKVAAPILKFIRYNTDNFQNYFNQFKSMLDGHLQGGIATIRSLMDNFYNGQNGLIRAGYEDPLKQQENSTTRIVDKLDKDLTEMRKNLRSFVRSEIAKIFPSSLRKNLQQEHLDAMKSLTDTAVNVARSTTDCCRKRPVIRNCQNDNWGKDQQWAFPGVWGDFRQKIDDKVVAIFTALFGLYQSIDTQLANPNITINQLYTSLKDQYQQISFENSLQEASTLFQEAKAKAEIVNVRCGTNLGGFRSILSTTIKRYNQVMNEINQLRESYKNFMGRFNLISFQDLDSKLIVPNLTSEYLAALKGDLGQFYQLFEKLKKIGFDYNIDTFMSSESERNQIPQLYGLLKQSLNEICNQKGKRIEMIHNARQQLRSLSNSFDENESLITNGNMKMVQSMLQQTSNTLFDVQTYDYFCNKSKQFTEDSLRELMNDFDSIPGLVDFYRELKITTQEGTSRFQEMAENAKTYENTFLQLLNSSQMYAFLKVIMNDSEEAKELVQTANKKLTSLKESANGFTIFRLGSSTAIQDAINLFSNSPLAISSDILFTEQSQLRNLAADIIDKLDFDVIGLTVLWKAYKQWIETFSTNLAGKSDRLSTSFTTLVNSFLSLGSQLNQRELNALISNISSLNVTLLQTVFTPFQLEFSNLGKRFFRLEENISRTPIKKRINFILALANTISVETTNFKLRFINVLNDAIYQTNLLLKDLQIGNLNELFTLNNIIQTQLKKIINLPEKTLAELTNFPNYIKSDFRQIFNLETLFADVRNNVENEYQRPMQRILEAIEVANLTLVSTPEFYKKLINTEVYEKIKSIKSNLNISFEPLSEMINKSKPILADKMKNIGHEAIEQMKQLNQLKENVSQIIGVGQNRLQNIENNLNLIRRSAFNFRELIFTALTGEIQSGLREPIKAITNDIDNFVNINLKNISDISKVELLKPLQVLGPIITQVVQSFESLKMFRLDVLDQFGETGRRITQFIDEKVTGKLNILRDAQIFLQSMKELTDPLRSSTIYLQYDEMQKMPIVKQKIQITTAIGVFTLDFEINFLVGFTVSAQIREFSNIKLMAGATAALQIRTHFSYGVFQILEFELLVQGDVLRADIFCEVEFQNIVPTNLFGNLPMVTQMLVLNKIRATILLEVEFKAVAFSVGITIRYIWIKIVFGKMKVCFSFKAYKICITFPSPIGFEIIKKSIDLLKKEYTPLPIPKFTILNKRFL